MSSFFLGRCVHKTTNNVIQVVVPRMKFDQLLNMHFRESDEIPVRDVNNQVELGDWIMVKKMDVKKMIGVEHELMRVVYKNGHYICPLTGKRSFGYLFKDEYDSFAIRPEDEIEEKTIEEETVQDTKKDLKRRRRRIFNQPNEK